MPLYEYECEACRRRFEIIQKFSDAPPEACPKCGKGPVQRQMSSPAIQFKGTGWYITDYSKKGKSGDSSGGDAKPAAGGGDKPAASEGSSKTDTTTPAAPAKPKSSSDAS